MDDMKEVVRDKAENMKELEKPPQELAKAEKVERRSETSDRVQEALKSTPRSGLQRQYATIAYREELKRYREEVGPTD
eukprot:6233115-Heterocapsa_arctica.AAC.1